MAEAAFLTSLGLSRTLTSRSIIQNVTRLCHSQGAVSPISPSTNLRNSAQFLRTQWQAALARSNSLICIDATAGRGSDTITLAEYIGIDGIIHSFDIQEAAISETGERYAKYAQKVPMAKLQLHNRSHANFSFLNLSSGSVAVVTYNLGWYPGRDADRTIITTTDSTMQSLNSAKEHLAVGGVISIMAYIGHPGGKEEEQAVLQWTSNLRNTEWSVAMISYPNRAGAPSLFLCERVS